MKKVVALAVFGLAAVTSLSADEAKVCTPATCKTAECKAVDTKEQEFCAKLNPEMKTAFNAMTAEQRAQCMKSTEKDANMAVKMMMPKHEEKK